MNFTTDELRDSLLRLHREVFIPELQRAFKDPMTQVTAGSLPAGEAECLTETTNIESRRLRFVGFGDLEILEERIQFFAAAFRPSRFSRRLSIQSRNRIVQPRGVVPILHLAHHGVLFGSPPARNGRRR